MWKIGNGQQEEETEDVRLLHVQQEKQMVLPRGGLLGGWATLQVAVAINFRPRLDFLQRARGNAPKTNNLAAASRQ